MTNQKIPAFFQRIEWQRSSIWELIRAGAFGEANKKIARLEEIWPDLSGIAFMKARICSENRDVWGAIKVLTTFSDTQPWTRTGNELLAFELNHLGDMLKETEWYETAVRWYDQVIQESPDDPVLYAEKGIVICNLNRYSEAEIALKEALRLYGSCGKTWSGLAWCLGTTRPEEAESCGDRAVALIPEDWGPWNNRGVARLALGNGEGAADDFRMAVFLAPHESIPIRGLHRTLYDMGSQDADQVFRSATIRFGPRLWAGFDTFPQMPSKQERHPLAATFDLNHPEVM